MTIHSTSEDQWIFPLNALEHTPSRYDGIDLEKELEARTTTINAIQSLYNRSRYSGDKEMAALAQEDLAGIEGIVNAGAMLVHRFYMRRSMKDFSDRTIAATILFLAAKMEEDSIKLRYLVNACLAKWEHGAVEWNPHHSNTKYHTQSKEYQRWENKILVCEELVLEALCFNMDLEMPYAVYERASATLREITWEEVDIEDMGAVKHGKGGDAFMHAIKVGEGLLSQAHFTPLLILFPAKVVACCALILGTAKSDKLPLQDSVRLCAPYAPHFGMTVEIGEDGQPVLVDGEQVRACCELWLQYGEAGLVKIDL